MKTGRRKQNRITKHSRIKLNSSAKRKISQLRSQWDVLDHVTRGERLQQLIELGCTRRGIANDIQVSPTNVRFHLDLAQIPQIAKTAVQAGASAKRAFDALQKKREIQARMHRIRQEEKTAAISDQLANSIVAFCNTGHVWKLPDGKTTKATFGEDLVDQFFAELDWAIEQRVRGILPRPPPAPLSMKLQAICKAVRPDRKEYDFWLAWLVEWLAIAILTAAREAAIREPALKKASGLLKESFKSTPSQLVEARTKRYLRYSK